MNTKTVLIAVVLLMAALLAGCGGESAPAALVNSCEKLTRADVEELFGQPVAAPEETTSGDAPESASATAYVSMCNYHTEGDPFRQASLLARQSSTPELAKAALAQTRKEIGEYGSITSDVSGVGDVAYWDATLKQLGFVQGSIFYLLTADATDGADSQTNAQTLAARVISR